jgi:hypothetical protein
MGVLVEHTVVYTQINRDKTGEPPEPVPATRVDPTTSPPGTTAAPAAALSDTAKAAAAPPVPRPTLTSVDDTKLTYTGVHPSLPPAPNPKYNVGSAGGVVTSKSQAQFLAKVPGFYDASCLRDGSGPVLLPAGTRCIIGDLGARILFASNERHMITPIASHRSVPKRRVLEAWESSGSTRRSRLRRRGYIDTTAAGWQNTLSVTSAKQYTLAGMIAYVTAYKSVSADLLKLYGSRTERAAAFNRRCQQRQFYASIPSALGVDADTVVCVGSGYLGSGASRGNVQHTGVMVGSVCLFVCLFVVASSSQCVSLLVLFLSPSCLFSTCGAEDAGAAGEGVPCRVLP